MENPVLLLHGVGNVSLYTKGLLACIASLLRLTSLLGPPLLFIFPLRAILLYGFARLCRRAPMYV